MQAACEHNLSCWLMASIETHWLSAKPLTVADKIRVENKKKTKKLNIQINK